jgi:hypothetical protein
MATLAQPLIGLFNGLRKVTLRRSGSLPSLASARLSDHDLADLNLPAHLRAKFDIERVRENATLNRYR